MLACAPHRSLQHSLATAGVRPGATIRRHPHETIRQGPAPDRRHPPVGAHSGRRDPRTGGRGGLRTGRAGAQALSGFSPRCRPGGRPRPQEAAQVAERRPDGERDPRLHLFQPPGQPGRRPPPHPPPRRARARGRHARGQHRGRPVAPALGRHCAQDHLQYAGQQLCVAGAHRPPHRSAAQEHSGRRARHRPAAGGARRHPGARPALQQRQGRAHPARAGRQRSPAARPRGPAVANAPAALQQAHRGR